MIARGRKYIYTNTSHSSSLKSVVKLENKRKINIILFVNIHIHLYIFVYFGKYKNHHIDKQILYYYIITKESTNYKNKTDIYIYT